MRGDGSTTTPLRYDNKLDNELEFIPNTEKRSHTCVMCVVSEVAQPGNVRAGHTLLTVTGDSDIFSISIIGNSTNVTPGTCRTAHRNHPHKWTSRRYPSQILPASYLTIGYRNGENVHVGESKVNVKALASSWQALVDVNSH
jgi:hypothetical protein